MRAYYRIEQRGMTFALVETSTRNAIKSDTSKAALKAYAERMSLEIVREEVQA